MANYPKKMMDPTEAALSAIQEALNIRDDEEQASHPPEDMAGFLSGSGEDRQQGAAPTATDSDAIGAYDPAGPASRSAEDRQQGAAATATDSEAIGTYDPAGPASRAANDDQQSIGQILRALQQRPARSSYYVATAFSCAWIVGCLSLSWAYLSDIHATLGTDRSPAALMIGLGAAALLPIIFFFGAAHMAWRAQELRLIAQSMARVAMRLTEPESVARDSIVTVGQVIRREVAAVGDGVERALARASELEALVQNEVAALERSYSDNEVRIRGLLQDLASQHDTLVGQGEQVRSSIGNVHIDLTQDLSNITDLVGQQVNEAAQRIAHSLAEKGEHITLKLGQIGDTMIQQLGDRGDDLLDRLEATSNETSRAIAAASDRLTSSLDFKTNHVSEEFADIATGLEDMMASRLDRITEGFSEKSLAVLDLMTGRSQELTEAVIETSSQLAETIATRADEVNSTLKSSGDSIILELDLRGGEVATKMQQAGNRITETLISRSSTMTDSVRERAEHIADVIAMSSDAIKEMLATRLTASEAMFSHCGAELGEKISRDSSTLGNLITRHLAEFDRTVKTYGAELVERLGARTQDVSESMRSYVDNFDSRVTSKTNEVTIALDQRLSRFQEALDSRSQTLTDALAARVVDIGKTIAAGGKDVFTLVDKRISEIDTRAVKLADTIGERIADIDASLGKGALEVANTLDTRVGHLEQLSESITTNSENAERALAQLAANTTQSIGKSAAAGTAAAEAIGRSANDAERKLVGMSTEVSRNIVGKANEINSAMTQRVEDMTRLLDEKSSGLLLALTNKGEHFAGEVGRVTDQAVQAIDAKGLVFTQTMLDKSGEIARLINDTSQTTTAAMTRTLGQMQEGARGVTEAAQLAISRSLDELHHATKTAIEESKQTAAATVSDLLATHTMVRSDSTALFERLREANILLQEVLSGAQENMSSLEHTMATRVSEFVAAMGDLSSKSGATAAKVEQHLGTFNTTTAKVLHDLGDLADHFSSHGRVLADAVELLETSNRRTEDSIASQHTNFENIETLVSTLDARTEDFGQRLQHFSGLLEESLGTATTRAREIAGIIAETSDESLQSIEQQYDLVRKTSEEERTRTSETLHTVYDEASAEVQAMFNQSAERFTEIMQGMKQMAAEMQQELETTRFELRRGILELPQETAESAAQMRRVIVDQIEALAELNRIVARHGRSLDAVEPPRREAEPLYATGAGRGQVRPMRADNAAPPSHPATRDITGAPARRANAPTLSPVPGGKDDNNVRDGGWLSDLLTRASRDESPSIAAPASREPPRAEERPQREIVDSIDSLSVDIARIIDHDAAAELWERYKRGERGVFTRQLYTPQGQKAFDEIRSKYRADPEFRQTVEHYIHEFERLLDDVSRGDRGPAVARNYLTSDTGKVYTMLAHAAGRFD
jgi:hypothetical protein